MGKRQDFINLARAGGSRQDFIDLAASFKAPLDPFKALTIYDMLMSGALPSELKHGGIASLAPRRGRVVNPGGYAGELEIPEGFLEDFKRRKYEDILDEYHRWKEDYERRKDLAPTQEVAQGGLAGILNL